jgi:hypothetical protein
MDSIISARINQPIVPEAVGTGTLEKNKNLVFCLKNSRVRNLWCSDMESMACI